MLTLKHLAVVQAALKFLDEEISPSGNQALADYLKPENKTLGVTTNHITESLQFFESVDLNYALVDSAGVLIESKRLLPAGAETLETLRSDLSLIATVLVPIE